jgi:methyltransferase
MMEQTFFYLFIFYIIQRISEVVLSNRNEKKLIQKYHAIEVSKWDSIRMKIFHFSWFVTFLVEFQLSKNRFLHTNIFYFGIFILFLCQLTRLSTILILKEFWTIKIYKMDFHHAKNGGLYRFFKHPNYLIVVLELFIIPAIFQAYWTAIIFGVMNLFILKLRIKLEEKVLREDSDYQIKMKNVFF